VTRAARVYMSSAVPAQSMRSEQEKCGSGLNIITCKVSSCRSREQVRAHEHPVQGDVRSLRRGENIGRLGR